VKNYSGGMKRRLNLAAALLHDPDILILDEPTVGVDPQSRNAIFDNLEALRGRGKALVYTTHYMEEAEQLCDRVAVMDSGRIVVEGPPRELIERYAGRDVFEIRHAEDNRVLAKLDGLNFSSERAGDTVYVFSADGEEIGRRLLSLRDFEVLHRRANLEDVFLRLTGRELRD
jgi:ABC-type multidrug transport system ATPase subunit